ARQDADLQAREVFGRAHLPYAIGDVPKAVLEPAEDAVVHALFDLAGEQVAEGAVHRHACGLRAREQERQIDDAELRYPIGQVARRLVAQRQEPVLDQPQNILGAIAELHDVPDILDLDALAEFGRQRVADELERAAEAGTRGAVASHADLNRVGHTFSREHFFLPRLRVTTSAAVASSRPRFPMRPGRDRAPAGCRP